MSEAFSGACLCGTVAYQGSGTPVRFYHCHCKRCRKATGAAHASNVFYKLGEFEFVTGEDQTASYKVPDAERFGNTFCTNCGSRLPRVVPNLSLVMVPAGSLDTTPSLKPMARIFWESRADWSCEEQVLPIHPQYPD